MSLINVCNILVLGFCIYTIYKEQLPTWLWQNVILLPRILSVFTTKKEWLCRFATWFSEFQIFEIFCIAPLDTVVLFYFIFIFPNIFWQNGRATQKTVKYHSNTLPFSFLEMVNCQSELAFIVIFNPLVTRTSFEQKWCHFLREMGGGVKVWCGA